MFVKSADGMITSSSSYTMSLCVQKLSHLSLEKVDKKLEWFNSKLYRFRLFHDWVCHTCDTAGQSSDSDFQPKISSYSERFRIKSAFRSQQENIKQSLSSNLSYEELLDISDDLNVGNGELQIKITGAAWANKKAGINLEPSPIIKTDTSANLTVLMYQRDASRRLVNMNTAMKRMGTLLGSRWTIKTIFHSDDLSPCTIINPIRKATVLITPHGFQSILLLFQPLSSVLVEVHPAFYLKQEVYGFIQAGLRQNFKLARSYLAEESIPVHFVTRSVARVLYFFRFSTHDCLHNAVCRNIARRQDVMISEAFMERIAIFISSHFTFGQK